MTLLATVTKQSVHQLTADDYTITIHVVVIDDLITDDPDTDENEQVIFEKDYSERYYSALDVDTVKMKLQQQIIVDWNRTVAESAIYDAVAFDTMVSEIQTTANNYINP